VSSAVNPRAAWRASLLLLLAQACVSARVDPVDADGSEGSAGCDDRMSIRSCGPSCQVCPAVTGGTPTCDGTSCGFTCQTGKKCGAACVIGCCNDNDCIQPDRVGKCDTAKHNCDYQCAQGKPCNGTCIARDACCTDADCGNYACVTGACSRTDCAPTGKMCNGACVEGSACCPSPESCLNGLDDDCDGNPDCADSDCQAATMCVPDPTDFALAVQLNTDAANCAAPYAKSKTVLHNTPRSTSSDCVGCSCTDPKADCRLKHLGTYPDLDTCNANGAYAVWDVPAMPEANGCYEVNTGDDPQGVVIERPDNEIERTCGSVTGTPKPPPIAWGKDATFCEMDRSSRAGCPGGKVCVPRTTNQLCAVATGTPGCPVGFNKSREIEWYDSADDARACVPATCACQAVGGTCPNQVSFGKSGECDNLTPPLILPIPSRVCVPDGIHGPGLKLLGTYTPPICSSTNKVSGSLTGKGQHTVCCL
jgi:hypothetical protein